MHVSKALHCSFCGKRENEVQRLIAGPSAYICDECTYLCALILVEKDVRPQIDAFRTEGSIAEIEAWIANAKPKSIIDSNDLP